MITEKEFKSSLNELDKVLTKREKDICYYIFLGYSNEYIAKKLGLSYFTIKDRLRLLYAKLKINQEKKLSQRICLMNVLIFDMNNLDYLIEKARIREKKENEREEKIRKEREKIKEIKDEEKYERLAFREPSKEEKLLAVLKLHKPSE